VIYRLCNILSGWEILHKNQDTGRTEEGVDQWKKVNQEAHARLHGWAPGVVRIDGRIFLFIYFPLSVLRCLPQFKACCYARNKTCKLTWLGELWSLSPPTLLDFVFPFLLLVSVHVHARLIIFQNKYTNLNIDVQSYL
jgi:hypothetical protein